MYLDDILIYTDDDGDGHVIAVRVGSRATQEVLAVCQPKEVLVLSGRDLVPRLYTILKKHPHGEQKNRDSQVVA